MFLVLIAILALVSLPTPSASQGDNTSLPLTLPPRVISTNEQAVCPPNEVLEMVRNETAQDIRNTIRNIIIPAPCLLGQTQANPVASPHIAPLTTTGLLAPMALQCRSTVTWTECVAAAALEDGHVLQI